MEQSSYTIMSLSDGHVSPPPQKPPSSATCPLLQNNLLKTRSPLYNPHPNLLPYIKTHSHDSFPSLVSMDSKTLKQRRPADDGPTATHKDINYNNDKRIKMAKRGLRSLSLAVSIPVALHLIAIYSSSTGRYSAATPFWFPPMWGLRMTCMASSFLMGLSAWLVWAEGGFHKHPLALPVYLSQLLLSLAWYPIVFGAGAAWLGVFVCMGMLAALGGCWKVFKDVNGTAGDLVMPCLAWVAFLVLVNFKLVYL